ncbi:MAG: hypothetical protein R3C24_12550 [Cyanobacteriota/Melainabacteria group bacterium]
MTETDGVTYLVEGDLEEGRMVIKLRVVGVKDDGGVLQMVRTSRSMGDRSFPGIAFVAAQKLVPSQIMS